MPPILLTLLIFLAALLYSSVGFGGASSYLAAMSLFSVKASLASSLSLILNLSVAGIAFVNFTRQRHIRRDLLWPFLITSAPAAFLGGALKLSQPVYQALLNAVLLAVGLRLLLFPRLDAAREGEYMRPSWKVTLPVGALLGLVSGMVGIGGGVFLSPLILFAGWGNAKHAAAAAAAFIVVNSLTGLAGRAWSGALEVGLLGAVLLPAGIIGGLLGSTLGSRRLPNAALQRLLAVVLLIVATRGFAALFF
ncbi:MAG: sulfite exporter TauE/SafE family protein [Chloroflexi bacterium]|nr:sulfite exporter TauE/SafE family protein [Chloroflexota bacterium]